MTSRGGPAALFFSRLLAEPNYDVILGWDPQSPPSDRLRTRRTYFTQRDPRRHGVDGARLLRDGRPPPRPVSVDRRQDLRAPGLGGALVLVTVVPLPAAVAIPLLREPVRIPVEESHARARDH